jgi:hypothetical protein
MTTLARVKPQRLTVIGWIRLCYYDTAAASMTIGIAYVKTPLMSMWPRGSSREYLKRPEECS